MKLFNLLLFLQVMILDIIYVQRESMRLQSQLGSKRGQSKVKQRSNDRNRHNNRFHRCITEFVYTDNRLL